MTEAYAYAACVILACLAIFQLALALGAPIGRFAWGGAHNILPTKLKIGSLVSIILYTLFAGIILDKAGIVDVVTNRTLETFNIWIITAYFFIGIVMNAISRSKPERLVMTPAALVLALLFLAVAIS